MTARIREFLKQRQNDGPCLVVDLDVVRDNYSSFAKALPDTKVFYAVKANPSPWVLDTLWANGIKNFDVASETEAALIATRFPGAQIAFMHPVKSRRAIARSFLDFGVKTFALDSEDELDKILQETGGAKDLTLMVRFAVSGDGAAYPLTRKFGVGPEDGPALLRRARGVSEEMLGVAFHARTDAAPEAVGRG